MDEIMIGLLCIGVGIWIGWNACVYAHSIMR